MPIDPTSPGTLWRPMAAADLPAVAAIAARVHPDYPENDAVFAERLRLYPAGCLVLAAGPELVAYVVSHPWHHLQPPALNSLLGALPAMSSTYYIHDVALLPQARGSGAGAAVVARLVAQARAEGLANLSLVAVNGSQVFWHRQGFAEVEMPALRQKLASYDAAARLMERRIA
ncbi:GNAT family N-acetyltransferase [Bradyrhizobium sp. 2TAF24]|uniref:GNAT family N-acetyltransferase n=1 Tax=Bradyrhizobium sp. 2TAF24 TaxID=3233011 RepID=UPI003F908C40